MSRLENLLENLHNADWTISVPAAQELRQFADDPQVIAGLSQALVQQDDLWLAIAAARSLEVIAHPDTIPALFSVLIGDSLEQELRSCADQSRQKGDYRGLVALAEHFGGEILDLKRTVARALVHINTQESLAALEAAKAAPDPYHLTAEAIRIALGNASNPAS